MNVTEAREAVKGLKSDLRDLKPELRDANEAFTTWLALGDQAGLPRDFMSKLRAIQQIRVAIQELNTSWQLLGAGGLLGLVTGGGGLLLGGFMLATTLMTLMQIRRPQY